VPEAALDNIRIASSRGVHSVVGTTGFDLDELQTITGANVIVAPNFALGAILMMRFAEQAARVIGSAEIIELHHDKKIDRPSGTARLTAERMRAASGGTEVPVHSVRLPGLVAHQEIIFGSLGETLTIRHDSIDRTCFMPGVLLAVRRIANLESSPLIGLDPLLEGI
jgi:4-hydroxy-tetrahydrodipicolinate reductase